MDNDLRKELIAKSPICFSGLKKLNTCAGIFLFTQGIIMFALGFLLTWKGTYILFILNLK
jgi:hypothetical protein